MTPLTEVADNNAGETLRNVPSQWSEAGNDEYYGIERRTSHEEEDNSASVYHTAASSPLSPISSDHGSINWSNLAEPCAVAQKPTTWSPLQQKQQPLIDRHMEAAGKFQRGSSNYVYFRVIVRRDKTGYGLTVCGSRPVTVRSIRPGMISII
ncbi:unnamed protein product [Protopolystoma xenopodis]|uniref:Uncharacterized protein n=1 Tax=Protopolystoma xenopodis TaxID=117903 RepID=A0A3S5A0R6_9PLAT|nr:unnamed protein product [Protopolystoma xenopodis]